MKTLVAFTAGIALLATGLWFGAKHEADTRAAPRVAMDPGASARGAAAFVGEDFGGLSLAALESHALPWKLVSAALVLEAQADDPDRPATRGTLNARLAEFGLLPGAAVVNLPAGTGPRPLAKPLGVTFGEISPIAGAPVEVANLGCAACHAGVTYDAEGFPRPEAAWIGMPNTSLNLEAYTLALFTALKAHADAPERLLGMVQTLYPDTGWRERLTLRWLVLPLVQSRLAETPEDRPLPFPNGVPGATNGVAALKHVFGLPLIGGGAADAGIVSIPDLGHRHWRSSLLADGAYAVPGAARQVETGPADNTPEKRAALAQITTFFTVPSMGVHPGAAKAFAQEATDIFEFLNADYAPQGFPGLTDPAAAAQGAALYAAECSACHGSYEITDGRARLLSFPNWIGDVGTDPLRAEAFSEGLTASIAGTQYAETIAVETTGAYVAPPLTGLWASAPYLHNGSVPTVWDLLSPQARPDRFDVGGHALDFDRLGLAYPGGYQPFSRPTLYDTRLPGQGNGGHAFGADLSDAEKRALIGFLKGL
ncbi:hypothetical protein [Pacificoceanicola onchidii]|uniref:c-type cytochrome n=1 Tax=Pacificoceanicola onchidii TaxID=2562685 RepID=UPI0010A3BBCD|nr:hypothetical protein [Pacificoceanicola onchidii]